MKSFAIVPAAGRSRRMGQPKLLLPWNDQATVIDATLERWRQSQVSQIVVVVRADDQPLIARCQQHAVQLLSLKDEPPQMKDSVTAALRWIEAHYAPAPPDVWLLAPADMPRLLPQVVNRLLDQHDPAAPKILQPVHEGQHGHPVLFPWPLANDVFRLPADQGINALRRLHPVRDVPCEEAAILDDLDTPADYETIRAIDLGSEDQNPIA